jgi:hypothetical protein
MLRIMKRFIRPSIAALLVTTGLIGAVAGAEHRHDVIIYGGTAGGLVSAVTAAQEGARVVVIEPTPHLGGMVTGGLGATDIGVEQSIGGMSRRFYEQVYAHYQQPQAWKHETREAYIKRAGGRVNTADRVWWAVEPSVASLVLNQLTANPNVTILTGQRIKSVTKVGPRIESLTTGNGDVFRGRVFIDATYEGDLLAMAGVSFHVGREARAQYGEELAGVVPEAWSTRKQWEVDIRPYGADNKLLFGVQEVARGEDGAGDRKIQAYNFRICLTDAPENRIPISRPERYDASRYDLLALYIARKGDAVNLTGPKGGSLLNIGAMPNRKTDINDGGPFSTDYIGGNWEYPEGDPATRERILRDHVDYTKGLLYFLGHDERVPARIQQQMQRWGYPKDEFPTTDHWSPQLYIREARRMVGDYIMTQHDIQQRREKPDSVGLGSYNADSHLVQRIVNAQGFVRNEGNPNDRAIGHKPYEIPYRCLTPRRADSDNLFATFCVSASHMGFASLRMEPVFMILSESAGVAAATAVKKNIAVQDVPVAPLQERLVARGQRLWLKDVPASKKKS